MKLIEEMTAAATHLKAATKLAADWRVRGALAGAATAVLCALHLQQKISAGKLRIEHRPDPPPPRHD